MKRMAIAGVLGLDPVVLVATSSSEPPELALPEGCEEVRTELPLDVVDGASGVRVWVEPTTGEPLDLMTTFEVENPTPDDCAVAAYLSHTLPDLSLAPLLIPGEAAPESVDGFGDLVDEASLPAEGQGRREVLGVSLSDQVGEGTIYLALAGVRGGHCGGGDRAAVLTAEPPRPT